MISEIVNFLVKILEFLKFKTNVAISRKKSIFKISEIFLVKTYLKSGIPEDPVRPIDGCSNASESIRIKVPDLVLTNLSGFLKLEFLGICSGLESMLFFRFKSALNSLSFICVSDMFILFDFCWRGTVRFYDETDPNLKYTLNFYRNIFQKIP